MAIGDGNYGGSGSYNNHNGEGSNNNRLYENAYYSRYNIRNDDKQLNIWFRSGLLVFEIDDIDQTTYKRTPLENIYLSPAKAYMFVNEIKNFKNYRAGDDIKENVAFGITGGMKEKVSYMGLHTNENKDIFVTIGKFDENGQIVESATMQLNKDYNYSIQWDNIEEMKLNRVFDNDMELNMIHYAVADFARNMSGSAAYSHADLTRYDNARILGKMNPIYDALGIDRKSYGGFNNNNRGSNDFLSNSNTTSKSTSIDEVTDLLN